jgi:hypothetical protein
MMRAKLAWLLVVLGAVFAPLLKFFRSSGNRDEESKKKADDLKAKVAEVKAERDARQEATNAAVVKVDEAAAVDVARDSVALANDLVRDAGKS